METTAYLYQVLLCSPLAFPAVQLDRWYQPLLTWDSRFCNVMMLELSATPQSKVVYTPSAYNVFSC